MNDYEKIIKHYGVLNQKNKAIEELNELIIALTNADYENTLEEIADVLNMLNQLQIIYEIDPSEVEPVNGLKIQVKMKDFVREMSHLQRRIAQEQMGTYDRDKMVRSIKAVKQQITFYGETFGVDWKGIAYRMDEKNARTLNEIEEIEKRVSEINNAKAWMSESKYDD